MLKYLHGIIFILIFDINQKQRNMTNIQKILRMADQLENTSILFSDWLRCIASAILLETVYKEVFEINGKPIGNTLPELPTNITEQSSLEWANITYDRYHPTRNNVETLDSIEEVKVYFNQVSDAYGVHFYLNNFLCQSIRFASWYK